MKPQSATTKAQEWFVVLVKNDIGTSSTEESLVAHEERGMMFAPY